MESLPGPPEQTAALLAAIVESSDDAIVTKTLDGVITSWNGGAERIFGYTAAEAVGRHITLIIPQDRLPEEDDVLARVRRGDRVDHFDTARLTKDGRLIAISLTVSPVRDAGGRIVGASKVARDVTERKTLEAENRVLLAREKRAREEAEALSRSKDEFLATLSHEFRTPLNAIFGWARLLQLGEVDQPAIQEALEAIIRNASAQVRLVEDLLDVSRIVTGNMRLEMRPVDPRTVIESALAAVGPAAQAKGVAIETAMDRRPLLVMGAPERLQQVVWNLLMNAVKFTPAGGSIALRVRHLGEQVQISVSDTGEGIAADLLPNVFDRFRQGDSTPTRRHGGLGLGLALVRHFVDLHGGRAEAESPGLGQGATFTVTLPLADAARTARPSAPVRSGLRSAPGGARKT